MNKFIASALGILLLIGAGAQAFASSPVEFSGYVKVFHESLSNFSKAARNPVDRDNFFSNKLNINVRFQPNDNVMVFWQFRGPNYQRFGMGNTALFTRALYGQIETSWGTIRGGHIVDGLPGTVGGLASFGYAPAYGDEFLYNNVFDMNSPIDALTYSNKWELAGGSKLGLAVYYGKLGANLMQYDATSGEWDSENVITGQYPTLLGYQGPAPTGLTYIQHKDIDYDVFGAEGTFEWETGGLGLGLEYSRNMTDPGVKKDRAFFVNPSFFQAFGPVTLHFEGKYGWGERTYDKKFANDAIWKRLEDEFVGHPWDGTLENKGLGLYLDAVWDYGQGDVTLAGWYVSGTDLDNDREKLNSLVNLGDFAPFLVAFNDQTLGNGHFSDNMGQRWIDRADSTTGFTDFNSGQSNQMGVGILGNHTLVPDKVSINYGIGYFRLVKPAIVWYEQASKDYVSVPFLPRNMTASVNRRPQSKDLGWEIDLGAKFQIMENVSFETQFGYFFSGDAFDTWDSKSKGWVHAKDTFAWASVLSFSF
ncbi:MAG: hypothetical protein LBF40_04665 [Deltaproteobacteria bacterium]|nr:hypothetical protein [Deltaproteobacteria bacterium]